jgi:hypothetical protein
VPFAPAHSAQEAETDRVLCVGDEQLVGHEQPGGCDDGAHAGGGFFCTEAVVHAREVGGLLDQLPAAHSLLCRVFIVHEIFEALLCVVGPLIPGGDESRGRPPFFGPACIEVPGRETACESAMKAPLPLVI